jgi:hypothetical protein
MERLKLFHRWYHEIALILLIQFRKQNQLVYILLLSVIKGKLNRP